MGKISIIVNSCDAYDDVWKPFFLALSENWQDLKYPILLNTENKSFTHNGLSIRTLFGDRGVKKSYNSWGERLLEHLKSIKTDYVLMLFDDYLVEHKVDNKKIELCKEWMDNNKNIAAFYLIHKPFIKKTADANFHGFSQVLPRSDYLMSSAPALWNRKHLISLVGKKDTPWAWEFFGTARAYRKKITFFGITHKKDEIYKYPYYCGGAIHRGKWVKEVIDPVIEKYSLDLDCNIRGYDEDLYTRRNIAWYFNFYSVGWKMIKFDIFIFIKRAVFRRIKKLFKRTRS